MRKERWIFITRLRVRMQVQQTQNRVRNMIKGKNDASMPRLLCGILLTIAFLGRVGRFSALAAPSSEIFSDITQAAGIKWQQFSGESADRFLIETTGGGVAFIGFDNGGLLD